MEDYNIYGWSALHEACYKGYTNAIVRFLDYAKGTQKKLIEMKTVDDYKTTPIIIAALGGHMEVVELLIKNGANIHAKLNYNSNVKHGIVEVAAIRQHIELLVFLYDKVPDVCKRLRDLMISDQLDNESRASIGRTVQIFSLEYSSIMEKLPKFKTQINEAYVSTLLNTQQKITFYTLNHQDFGNCLSIFLKLSEDNEDAISSCALILLDVINEEKIRKSFCQNKGISYFLTYMEKHKEKMIKKKVEFLERIESKRSRSPKKLSWFDSHDYLKAENDKDGLMQIEQEDETYIGCASIGQALNALSRYDECLEIINRENGGEKIINYTKCLFEWHEFCKSNNIVELVKTHDSNTMNNDDNGYHPILFEQYIFPYIKCLANLTFTNNFNKHCFLNSNLFERILTFWKEVQYLIKLNDKNTIQPKYYTFTFDDFDLFTTTSILFKSSTHDDLSSNSDNDKNETEDELKIKSMEKFFESLSPVLVKNLRLSIIECIGKVLYNNFDLKNKYIYSNEIVSSSISPNEDFDKDWLKMTDRFIKTMVTYLDPSGSLDRELQLEVLKFIRLITENDFVIQNRLVSANNAFNSSLISNFRNLLRKNSPINIKTSAMLTLWSVTGGKNYEETYDRKCTLYRAIGAQKFVDILFDCDDELAFICLEALSCIASSPPNRDTETNDLIRGSDEVAKVQAVAAVLRLLKSSNPKILFSSLRTLSDLCVTSGYLNNVANQLAVAKLGGILTLVDLTQKKSLSDRLKCEAYHCLSMVTLNNPTTRKILFKSINFQTDTIIKDLKGFFNSHPSYNRNNFFTTNINNDERSFNLYEEMEDILTKLSAGLSFCGFSFQNEDFLRKMIITTGKINWDIYKAMLIRLNILLEKVLLNKDKDGYFQIQRARCLIAYQIIALYSFINLADEDPRAIGMKIIVDLIPNSKSTYLRSIACDYIGRLILMNNCLMESLMSINSVEILSLSTFDGSALDLSELRGDSEKSNASISLKFFTDSSPEARRRLLKMARKNFKIMNQLKYSNEYIHIDLLREWKHYKDLNDSSYIFSKTDRLPPLKKSAVKKLLPKRSK